MHVLSEDAFDVIGKIFVGNLRLYRPSGKPGKYMLTGFESNTYSYRIKNIELLDLPGCRTIVPIVFVFQDRYYNGIHRDKLLSSPVILYEESEILTRGIDKVWRSVVQNLIDESNRLLGRIDLEVMSVLNALSRRDRMTEKVKESIRNKTNFYVSNFK